MSDQPRDLPHLFISSKSTEPFTPKGGGKKVQPPDRERGRHADRLQQQIDAALIERRQLVQSNPEVADSGGFYMTFRFDKTSGAAQAIESLENRHGKAPIELMAVKDEGAALSATVFIPDERKDFFSKRVSEYKEKDTGKGKPRNEALVSRIDSISYSRVSDLFTDDLHKLPEPANKVWWEVWLTKNMLERFRRVADRQQLITSENSLKFSERDVILVNASMNELNRVLNVVPKAITELRLHRETSYTFVDMPPREQRAFVEDLQDRTIKNDTANVYVCIVDSGVTQSHPLIQEFLDLAHCHSTQATGGEIDRRGHGTQLAGLALYGDLSIPLQTGEYVYVNHKLESSKLLPDNHELSVRKELRGSETQSAIALAEISNPGGQRIVCLANTDDEEDTGIPTSWSAALDQIAFEDDETFRLVLASAGNIWKPDHNKIDYLELNDVEGVENPGQAWNVLTVGAYTTKTLITDPTFRNYSALALAGGLTPTSRTSVIWERQWPIKPEIVFEGGNRACAPDGQLEVSEDLSLLTTHHELAGRLLDTIDATSAATALASRFAAQIQHEYQTFRPETVRAVMVHSAEWTPVMLASVANPPKLEDKELLLRRYGYGVPSIDLALKSAKNDLALVVESQLNPYKKNASGTSIVSGEMNVHSFPWPKEMLQAMGEAKARMRVTLSYFIEPNPGKRGWGTRHSYQSHGLRFAVRHANESIVSFRKRVNKAAEGDDNQTSADPDKWFLYNFRGPGSVFSDWWEGDAVSLSEKDAIAVYPVGGWRKHRPYRDDWQKQVRYSLIVSISVPENDVDLYLPISQALEVALTLPVTIETSP